MNTRKLTTISAIAILTAASVSCTGNGKASEAANDTNTPLHLMQPEYETPYGELKAEDIKADMDRVLHYLQDNTPAALVDEDGKEIADFATITAKAKVKPGAFRLTSYEWGVTYSAMLDAAETTGDKAYYDYVVERLKFIAKAAPHFRRLYDQGDTIDLQMRKVVAPRALDDAGAVCVAMIRAMQKDSSLDLKPLIDNYMDYVLHKEHRLADGTFARNRPHHNTLWLDDMFMGIPPVAWYSLMADDREACLDEAAKQVMQFAERMWVEEKGLFRHGWVEEMEDHPAFHWGRANGWALLTMCEVLDILPESHPQRDNIMELFRSHVRGLAALQSGKGFWHQLLDRNDSYLETSATAIYVYCMAHAINQGWIDAMAYGPVVQLGWHAVSTKITNEGMVEGTCVGTGMAFDPAFYYYRPVNAFAAHGYGPVIWAGAEMLNLLKHQHPKMNDSAVQYYRTEQKTNAPIFSVREDGEPVLVE